MPEQATEQERGYWFHARTCPRWQNGIINTSLTDCYCGDPALARFVAGATTKWTVEELRGKANEWDAVSVNGDSGVVARAVMVRFLAFLESLE